jgi:hypothetical protein
LAVRGTCAAESTDHRVSGDEYAGELDQWTNAALVAIASAVALARCYSESTAPVIARHMQPLSERMVADLESRNMAKGSPILVRIFINRSISKFTCTRHI